MPEQRRGRGREQRFAPKSRRQSRRNSDTIVASVVFDDDHRISSQASATQTTRNEKRRREGRSMKLLATVMEAVADAQVKISQEEDAEARLGPPGPRTDQGGGAEQPDICQ